MGCGDRLSLETTPSDTADWQVFTHTEHLLSSDREHGVCHTAARWLEHVMADEEVVGSNPSMYDVLDESAKLAHFYH